MRCSCVAKMKSSLLAWGRRGFASTDVSVRDSSIPRAASSCFPKNSSQLLLRGRLGSEEREAPTGFMEAGSGVEERNHQCLS